jgi:hypothetical protein
VAVIDFPTGPTVGQTFVAANGATYKWTGIVWSAALSGVGGTIPSNILQMYSEQVLTVPGTSLQAAIPPAFKRLRLQIYLWAQDSANHGPGLNINGMASASGYYYQGTYSVGINASGYSGNASFWQLPNGWVHFMTFEFGYSGGGINGVGNVSTLNNGIGRIPYNLSLDAPGTLSGSNSFWCTYVDLAQMAAGSSMRVFSSN